jgi:hypothetical protein
MKNYRFILGLTLSILSTVWLAYLVRQPVIVSVIDSNLSGIKGKVSAAVISFCVGIGLILFDTFTRNPQREKLEAEKKFLRGEILAMLPDAEESQQELQIYINQTLGKTGILGLELNELERVKNHVRRKIAERLEEQTNIKV